jgi:hypothetical protein
MHLAARMKPGRALDLHPPHPVDEHHLALVTGGRWVKLGDLQPSYRNVPANVQPLVAEGFLAVLPQK